MVDFLRYRFVCFAGSLLLLVAGVFAYFAKGGFKYHIDFVGGAEIRISFQDKLNTADLRKALSDKGWKDLVIQSVGSSGKDFLVRLSGENISDLEENFTKAVDSSIKSNKMTIGNIDAVGAEVGKDMQWNALIAVLLSLLLMLIYISVRSKYAFAVGAVVAIAHDILAVLVFLLLFNEPISVNVLAAILAILGYSINDTIVIFGRIRENLKKMKGVSREVVVNTSINQTMKRTMLTSVSTLLAVGSFFVLGGEALRGFSLAMLVGIVVGTYSSVYIASPVMLAIGSLSNKSEK